MRRVKEKEEMSRTNTTLHCQQAMGPNYDQNDQCDQNVHDDLKNCTKVFSTYNCSIVHELKLKPPLPPINILLTFSNIHIAGDLFWKI